MLPNYLHIGAAKAASTYIWTMFQEHSEIYATPVADNCSFFMCSYHRGLAWYEQVYFSQWQGEKAVGEFSNSYMLFEPALERINRDLPDVKLSLTLRNPIDTCFLQWAQNKRNSFWLGEWAKLDAHFKKMLNGSWQTFRAWAEIAFYASHLKRIYRHFPKERVLITLYDDLLADSRLFLKRFFEFLEVDQDFVPSQINTVVGFPGSGGQDTEQHDLERGLPPSVRAELRGVFREDIDELQEMIGRDLSHWV